MTSKPASSLSSIDGREAWTRRPSPHPDSPATCANACALSRYACGRARCAPWQPSRGASPLRVRPSRGDAQPDDGDARRHGDDWPRCDDARPKDVSPFERAPCASTWVGPKFNCPTFPCWIGNCTQTCALRALWQRRAYAGSRRRAGVRSGSRIRPASFRSVSPSATGV